MGPLKRIRRIEVASGKSQAGFLQDFHLLNKGFQSQSYQPLQSLGVALPRIASQAAIKREDRKPPRKSEDRGVKIS